MKSSTAKRRSATGRLLILLVVAGLPSGLGCVAWAQDPNKANTDEETVRRLLQDSQYTLEDVLNHRPKAVARMIEIFRLTLDPNIKERTASILVRSGIEDPIYFEYLTDEARKALDNDMPWPVLYDKDGNKKSETIDALNPEFLKWCKQHDVDPSDTFYAAYYEIPLPWYHLGAAGDPRAYDLLIKGLHSRNPMISTWAAHGLARLRDPRAIDDIITVARRAPLESRYAVAEALLYFQDAKAQAAVEEIVTDKQLLTELRKQVTEKGIKWLFNF